MSWLFLIFALFPSLSTAENKDDLRLPQTASHQSNGHSAQNRDIPTPQTLEEAIEDYVEREEREWLKEGERLDKDLARLGGYFTMAGLTAIIAGELITNEAFSSAATAGGAISTFAGLGVLSLGCMLVFKNKIRNKKSARSAQKKPAL